jgi:hypothetical protein
MDKLGEVVGLPTGLHQLRKSRVSRALQTGSYRDNEAEESSTQSKS